MLMNFKAQFAPYILEGSKTHTIRAKRKITPRVGEICHCYTGLRQKGAKLLGRWKCTAVQEIEIRATSTVPWLEVLIDGERLGRDEAECFLHRDGFRGTSSATSEAEQFWRAKLPFDGHLIHWKFIMPFDPAQPKAVKSIP